MISQVGTWGSSINSTYFNRRSCRHKVIISDLQHGFNCQMVNIEKSIIENGYLQRDPNCAFVAPQGGWKGSPPPDRTSSE
jgi:hypothetical protein